MIDAIKDWASPLVSRLIGNRPRVFVYHRFSSTPDWRRLATPAFREQLAVLTDRFEIVTMATLFDPARPGVPKRPRACITIDDGYSDFYDFAFPVLKAAGASATIFVPSGFIDGQLWLWPDRIHAVLDAAPPTRHRISGVWGDMLIDLTSVPNRRHSWELLADRLLYESPLVREAAIASLAQLFSVDMHTLDMSAFAPMTWIQLKEIQSAGFEIADHSYSHPCLPTLPDEDLRHELTRSKELLEARLGTKVRSFAYPNGTRRDYDERTKRVLIELGYENAALSVPGRLDSRHRMEIGRFHGDCSLRQFRWLADGYGLLRA